MAPPRADSNHKDIRRVNAIARKVSKMTERYFDSST